MAWAVANALAAPVARERDASPSARDGVDDVRLLPDGSAVLVA